MSWRASGEAKKITKGCHGEKLRHADKLALLVIADDYNDHQGYAWASRTTLAEECLCSERTVLRLTDRLVRFGLLSVEHRNGSSNLYRLPFITTPDKLATPPTPNDGTRSATPLTPTPATPLTPELDLTIKTERVNRSAQTAESPLPLKPLPKPQKKIKNRYGFRRSEIQVSQHEFIDFAARRREAAEKERQEQYDIIARVAAQYTPTVGGSVRKKTNSKGNGGVV